jgi:hypothetical protein
MEKLITITRAETTHVEQNWRQGGGRVLTFDMMLEIPQSQKVAALALRSEILFEGKRYTVHQKEVLRKSPPETVRLLLTRADGAADTWPTHSGRHRSPPSLSRVVNVPSFPTQAEETDTLSPHTEQRR